MAEARAGAVGEPPGPAHNPIAPIPRKISPENSPESRCIVAVTAGQHNNRFGIIFSSNRYLMRRTPATRRRTGAVP